MDWITIKTLIADTVGLSRDASHVVAGFGAQLFLVFAFRSSFRAFWPLLVVVAATLANEWVDLTAEVWPEDARQRQWWESGKDIVLTIMIPAALIVLSRVAPSRFAPAQEAGESEHEPAGEAVEQRADED